MVDVAHVSQFANVCFTRCLTICLWDLYSCILWVAQIGFFPACRHSFPSLYTVYYLDGGWNLFKACYLYYGYLLWTKSFSFPSYTSAFIYYEIRQNRSSRNGFDVYETLETLFIYKWDMGLIMKITIIIIMKKSLEIWLISNTLMEFENIQYMLNSNSSS